jgi:nitric oxide dioxygenase
LLSTKQKALAETDCAWLHDAEASAYFAPAGITGDTKKTYPSGEGEMSLTVDQIRLVTESYKRIRLSPRPYSEIFYYRLLLDHPFARALFPDDMAHQAAIFSKTIDALVANVADIVKLNPLLSDLGKKHVKYGVKAYQYEAVGTVLIDTFADILGERFTPATRQAWEAVYSETAGIMISAAYSEI